jgi:hypothetical protein
MFIQKILFGEQPLLPIKLKELQMLMENNQVFGMFSLMLKEKFTMMIMEMLLMMNIIDIKKISKL